MSITLTREQQCILDAAIHWYYHEPDNQLFQFAGNPGTGKTFLMNSIIKALDIDLSEVAPMAYVGAAAINMRVNGGLSNAKTIHSMIYDPVDIDKRDKNGRIVINQFYNRPERQLVFKRKNLDHIKLFIVDEGGTVPAPLARDILSFGKKVLVAGDLDQLPPVRGIPGFLNNGKVYRLTQIMRQEGQSKIIELCQRAKAGYPIHPGEYGGDVLVMNDTDFWNNPYTDQTLINSNIILCGRNSTRDFINNRIREICGRKSNIPEVGEKIVCKKNNWFLESCGINLTNGLTGVVTRSPGVGGFDGKCFSIDFKADIIENCFFRDVNVDYNYFTSDYETKDRIKMNGQLVGNAIEFGYCQTVNTAQGGQWDGGIYFEEYLPRNNDKRNYTALSRFRKRCIYVKSTNKYVNTVLRRR